MSELALVPKRSNEFLEILQEQAETLKEFLKSQMRKDVDYGIFPGTSKPTLYKPGAQKLLFLFNLRAEFEELRYQEDWEKGFFFYVIRCTLYDKKSGSPVAQSIASCNSKEERYRWRSSERVCPECGQPAVVKGKKEYGGGWICFKKKGGCGAKFQDGDVRIEGQTGERVENPEPYSSANTILAMAKKRAFLGAIQLAVPGISDLFAESFESEYGSTVPEKVPEGEDAPPRGTTLKPDYWTYVYGRMRVERNLTTEQARERGMAALKEAGGDEVKALELLKSGFPNPSNPHPQPSSPSPREPHNEPPRSERDELPRSERNELPSKGENQSFWPRVYGELAETYHLNRNKARELGEEILEQVNYDLKKAQEEIDKLLQEQRAVHPME